MRIEHTSKKLTFKYDSWEAAKQMTGVTIPEELTEFVKVSFLAK